MSGRRSEKGDMIMTGEALDKGLEQEHYVNWGAPGQRSKTDIMCAKLLE